MKRLHAVSMTLVNFKYDYSNKVLALYYTSSSTVAEVSILTFLKSTVSFNPPHNTLLIHALCLTLIMTKCIFSNNVCT